MLNPRVVEGQLHGATAQGLGGALLEEIVYDADGQNLSATLLDYAMPIAARVPSFEVEHLERPDPNTPLGMKGMAEGGVMGASAAISNAVADALAPLGVAAGRQPFTPRGSRQRSAPRDADVDATDLCFTSAVELAELIRRRALSPVEITRAVLERIERLNPRLGAYVLVHAERALTEARAAEQAVMAGRPLGPLHGVPVSIKDNLWTAGERTTFGSRLLAEFVAPEDAPSVAGLRAAGAIFVGRTNLPEFAWRGSTDNPLFGESRNPWDLTRTPGGSTGGGAAAVAAGLGPLALGSDGAGSIRIPASFCGLVGLKPTFGRVPMYPAAGGNELVAHVCPLARTVRDVALMMNAIARSRSARRVRAPRRRRGLPDRLQRASRDARRCADAGRLVRGPRLRAGRAGDAEDRRSRRARLLGVGLTVEEASPDLGDPSVILKALYGGAQAGAHAARSPEQKAQMDPELVRYAEASAGMSVVEYVRAVAARQAMVDALRRFFERYDLLLTPTLVPAGLPARPRRPPRGRRPRGDPPGLDALLSVQLQRPAGRLRARGLDGKRPTRRAADRRPSIRGCARAARRGGIRGAPPVGRARPSWGMTWKCSPL